MIENDMKENDKATYTLWHAGDLIATGTHNRDTFMDFIARGCELVDYSNTDTAEIYSSRDDGQVWSYTLADKRAALVDDVEPYDGFDGCWPGDGSGMDDLADYNAMEGCDY